MPQQDIETAIIRLLSGDNDLPNAAMDGNENYVPQQDIETAIIRLLSDDDSLPDTAMDGNDNFMSQAGTVIRLFDNNLILTTAKLAMNTITPPIIKCFHGFCIVLAIIALVVIINCILTYVKSVASRKFYICPNCGESFRAEHMEAKTCKVCGTDLKEIHGSNITDKTK